MGIQTSLPLLFLFSLVTAANLGHAGEKHHHAAHVHGEAQLTLLAEGQTVQLAFHSPAMNILGFEGNVSTPQKKQAVLEADKILSSALDLFKFDGSRCEVLAAKNSLHDMLHKHGHDHHDHGHDSKHSDISAEYTFQCDSVQPNTRVSTHLFKKFSGLLRIEAQWVTDSGQGAAILSGSQYQFSLGTKL